MSEVVEPKILFKVALTFFLTATKIRDKISNYHFQVFSNLLSRLSFQFFGPPRRISTHAIGATK